jgi:predicted phosphodiesterase
VVITGKLRKRKTRWRLRKMTNNHFAVVSDIHSNLEALTAVMDDIKSRGIYDIYCLGDVMGYGPNPNEVIEIAQRFKINILGNHDGAVLNGERLKYFNPEAAKAALWTRKEVWKQEISPELSERNRIFLESMAPNLRKGDYLFSHGGVRDNFKYVRPRNCHEDFAYMKETNINILFTGHTHQPVVIFQYPEPNESVPEPLVTYDIIKSVRMIVNVGSVGQPRDYNPDACYVEVRHNNISFRRVEYDFEKTIKKINAIDEIDNFFGERLRGD